MTDKTAREKAIAAYEQYEQEEILKTTDKFKTLFDKFLDDVVSFSVENFCGRYVAKISSVPELLFLIGSSFKPPELWAKLAKSPDESRLILIKSWSDVGWCLTHLDEMVIDEEN